MNISTIPDTFLSAGDADETSTSVKVIYPIEVSDRDIRSIYFFQATNLITARRDSGLARCESQYF
jgi:hypothetical protein